MDLGDTLTFNIGVILACMVALWALATALRDASIVDIFWGLGFVIVAWVTFARGERGWHALLLAGMTTLWGVRLALYLARRNLGHGEDHRYQSMRKRFVPFWWKSFFIVFLLQGVLMFLVSLPVQVGMGHRDGGLTIVDVIGMVVFVVGFLFEAVGDAQLSAFKGNPANKGVVMDRGLWRYTRHPNYFGEFVLWWGIGLVALSTRGAWWAALLGPSIISFLLLRVSGVPLLEKSLQTRRPGYDAYIARTSSFFPRRPKST